MTALIDNLNEMELNLKAVALAVSEKLGCKISNLHVERIDGVIILSGRTSSFYHKQLASHAALNAVPHVAVSNRIEVN